VKAIDRNSIFSELYWFLHQTEVVLMPSKCLTVVMTISLPFSEPSVYLKINVQFRC
jgi:hypothetical protein